MGRKKKNRERVSSVGIEISPEADQLFRDAMAEEAGPLVDKDRQADAGKAAAKSAQAAKAKALAAGGRRGETEASVDLHGCTLDEAQTRVDQLFSAVISNLAGKTAVVTVVTGKGRHSGPGGGVLAREIHTYVQSRYRVYISRIEDSPAAVLLGGLPVRGHFRVWLTRP